jgi:hypothetical protein
MAISNPTPKQQRNGADTGAPGSGATMAQPGPDATREITSTKRQAENAGNRRATASVFGRPPHDPNVQWDAGLAINDVEGGGSG